MRLKELRVAKGLSQRELSKILGVAPNTLSQWERRLRSPDPETLKSLANYFAVTIDYLLNYDADPETKKDPSAEESKMVNEISYIYDKLSDEAKEKLLEYCSDLLGNPKNLK